MATLKEFLKADRFATCAGVELLEIKPGYARACMEVTDRHLNGGGVWRGKCIWRSLHNKRWKAITFYLILRVNRNTCHERYPFKYCRKQTKCDKIKPDMRTCVHGTDGKQQ